MLESENQGDFMRRCELARKIRDLNIINEAKRGFFYKKKQYLEETLFIYLERILFKARNVNIELPGDLFANIRKKY
jgi:hypothetical protein